MLIDVASLVVIEDWFASEEKLAVFEKQDSANAPNAANFTAKFRKRCSELLDTKHGVEHLGKQIFLSYGLSNSHDQRTFTTSLLTLLQYASDCEKGVRHQ